MAVGNNASPYQKKQTVFKCKECGVLFLRMPGRGYGWCCDGCRPVSQRRWWKQKNTISFCAHCNEPFIANQGAASIVKYCSTLCASRSNHHLDKSTGVFCDCIVCGKRFEKHRKVSGLFCSIQCSGKHRHKQSLKQKLKSGVFSAVYWGSCRVCDKEWPSRLKPSAVCKECFDEFSSAAYTAPVELLMARRHGRPCSVCGELFSPHNSSCTECSAKCKRKTPAYLAYRQKYKNTPAKKAAKRRYNAKRRAQKLTNGPYREIDPVVVCERDGWSCWICGISTPKHLRGTHDDQAPEMDHIVPLAAGGTHTWGNVACCCRKCNINKGREIIHGPTPLPEQGYRLWQDTQTQSRCSA